MRKLGFGRPGACAAEETVNRSSVYWINREPSMPPELGKVRPAVLISSSTYNERLDSVVVVPLSTKAPEIWPLRVKVTVPRGRVSFAVIPGIRPVSKTRLHLVQRGAPADRKTAARFRVG